MDEQIPVKQKILPKDIFKISPMKRKIKTTHPHKHDHYHELIYLSAGAGFHTIDLKRYRIEPPQLFLVKAEQVHHWEFTSIPKGHVVIFRSDFLVHLASSETLSGFEQLHIPFFDLNEMQATSFETIFEQMHKEFKEQRHGHNHIIASFLEIVLARMLRLSQQVQQNPTDSKQKLVGQYQELIREHLTEYHLVKDYAKRLYVSPKHLNEVCTDAIGKTASAVLAEGIILETKRRLLHTSGTVAEIGYAIGFSNPSNFSTFFKRHTSITPGTFRHKML